MYYGFKYLHPIKGQAPNTLSVYGEDVLLRARALLSGWTVTQLRGALKVVNWVADGPLVRDWEWSRLGAQVGAAEVVTDNGPVVPCLPAASRPSSFDLANIRACQHRIDLSGYPEIPKLSWATFYAVLAMGLVDKACDDEQYFGSWPQQELLDWQHEWRVLDHVAPWLIEAVEAVTLAEAHALQEVAFQQAHSQAVNQEKKRLSARNVQAAIQRHAKTGKAAELLYDFYRTGQYKSVRQAVQLFCEQQTEVVAHLAPTNRLRTLSERLGKLLRERPILPRPSIS